MKGTPSGSRGAGARRRRWARTLAACTVLTGVFDAAACPAAAAPTVNDAIAENVESIRADNARRIGGETIASTVVLPDMYERRAFRASIGPLRSMPMAGWCSAPTSTAATQRSFAP